MPEMKGIELLEHITHFSPETLVVIITAYGSIDSAIAALRKGAVDYILKPVEFDELLVKIRRLIAGRQLTLENKLLRGELHRQYDFSNIVGQSPAMAEGIRHDQESGVDGRHGPHLREERNRQRARRPGHPF